MILQAKYIVNFCIHICLINIHGYGISTEMPWIWIWIWIGFFISTASLPSSIENEDTDISTSSDIILCNSHLDDKTTSGRAISPANLKNQLSSMEDDVSTSSDIIFCNTSSQQPESTSVTVNSGATIKILTVKHGTDVWMNSQILTLF